MKPTEGGGTASDSIPRHRYAIGIDLGTTNSAMAYVDLNAARDRAVDVHFVEIPQLVGPGEVAPAPVLPSFLYLPGRHDLPPGSTALPWDPNRDYAVGILAREQGATVAGRLVTSAKSWLCHARVDRTAAILPWGARRGDMTVSPVEASARYLLHLREVWDTEMARGRPEHRFDRQRVILAVPASFDEVARELTMTAARQAGYPQTTLLEEPLAALYAWLHAHDNASEYPMTEGQLILVCDVGGGTTDFSIVGVKEGREGPVFNRLAVGEHLMLGGDNMDHALGRHLEVKMTGHAGKLDARRWQQLVHQCRKAKEQILDAEQPVEHVEVVLPGVPGKLIAGTLKATLTRTEVEASILDGFFPEDSMDTVPGVSLRAGLTELGLPYENDPAITRHLSAFWLRFQDQLRREAGREVIFPDYVLFNGGTLAPPMLRKRLIDALQHWFRDGAGETWSPVELDNPRPDVSVAMGAAYYGRVRERGGIRIGSGAARAFYVEVAGDDGRSAVCLAPRGMEEGAEIQLDRPGFTALTNQTVAFQLFSSSTRLGDEPGDRVALDPEQMRMLPPIRTVLRYGKKGRVNQLPVKLGVRLTEIGTLELWCRAQAQQWQLQFDVRGQADPKVAEDASGETLDEARVTAALQALRDTFKHGTADPEQLRRTLEKALACPRDDWPVRMLRRLADTLLSLPRDRSPRHEARWFNLLGYCLRPGYGDPMDDLRMRQAWKFWLNGPVFSDQVQVRFEWWVFWRRIAGGLSAERQTQIYHELRPFLQPKVRTKKQSRLLPRRIEPRERMEIWMALASLERLPADTKATLGRLLLPQFKATAKPHKLIWWALSRLGARSLIYGPLDAVAPPQEVASWFKVIFSARLERKESVAQALVLMARLTGDRSRDVPEAWRNRIARWLLRLPDGKSLRDRLLDADSAVTREEQEWMFGEALPVGFIVKSV